ncbi:MAG: hypothetical protein ACREL7_08685, partial [Longimicrobiales bacterium]
MNQFRDRSRRQQHPPAGQHHGEVPPQSEHQSVDQVWRGYLDHGYFDADGNLRIEYVSREKVEPLVREMARARPPLSQAQLRRFFQHCRRIEAQLKA